MKFGLYKRVYTLSSEGKTIDEIAEETGRTVTKVGLLLAFCDEKKMCWLAEYAAGERDQQVKRLEEVMHEAGVAWLKSQQDEVTVKKTVENGKVKRERVRKPQVGNPAYLAEMRAAMRDIREIRGLNAPVKVDMDVEIKKHYTVESPETL